MNNMLWSTGRYAVLVLLIFPVFLCRSNFASIDSVTSENVQVEGDCISVQAKEIILGELLKSIEKRTGIAFELNKALLEKEITISFKELSLLEGIKKIIYPLNYAIVYDPGDVVSKVIIVDRSNASPMTTLNVENNVFPPGSYDGPPLEDTLTEGEGGPHTPPGYVPPKPDEGPPGYVPPKPDEGPPGYEPPPKPDGGPPGYEPPPKPDGGPPGYEPSPKPDGGPPGKNTAPNKSKGK